MEKVKQLIKLRQRSGQQRLQRLRDSVLRAMAKIEQLEVAHTPHDYAMRTQLIGEIFMGHLEAHRQQFIEELLNEVDQLKQSNIVLQAEVDYLKTYTAPSKKIQQTSDDYVQNRRLTRLLLEESSNSASGEQETLRRELTQKFEDLFRIQKQRYEVEILGLQRRNSQLELELHEAQLRLKSNSKEADSIRSSVSDVNEVNAAVCCSLGDRPQRKSLMQRQSIDKSAFGHKGICSTLAATPIKPNDLLLPLNFKYLRRPQFTETSNY